MITLVDFKFLQLFATNFFLNVRGIQHTSSNGQEIFTQNNTINTKTTGLEQRIFNDSRPGL